MCQKGNEIKHRNLQSIKCFYFIVFGRRLDDKFCSHCVFIATQWNVLKCGFSDTFHLLHWRAICSVRFFFWRSSSSERLKLLKNALPPIYSHEFLNNHVWIGAHVNGIVLAPAPVIKKKFNSQHVHKLEGISCGHYPLVTAQTKQKNELNGPIASL